jgi:DUF4097 and DUF4098 domain-containing protein YvlB
VTRVGPLKIGSRGGDISIKEVKGSAHIRSHNGDVSVDMVTGRVDVETVNGDVSVRMADGGVWANSAVGDLDLNCIKGRIEANASGGSITISGGGGDVDAMAVGGDVSYRGLIRGDGTYRLKSLSGSVEMTIQSDAPGFRASLSTYSGEIETAFPLRMETPNRTEPINRKMIGTYKGGGAQITLDSFSASATLMKAAPNTLKDCK